MQDVLVETEIDDQPLKFAALVLELLQNAATSRARPAIELFPAIEFC
jgi:hypothetical protein